VKNLIIPENKKSHLNPSSPLMGEDKGGGEKINNAQNKNSSITHPPH
jgi:hypothetical protein